MPLGVARGASELKFFDDSFPADGVGRNVIVLEER